MSTSLMNYEEDCSTPDPRKSTIPLLGWLDNARDDRGIRLLVGSQWEFHSYAELARRVKGAAAEVSAACQVPGRRVAVVGDNAIRFTEGFFGALAGGNVPVPVPPPTLLGEAYRGQIADLLLAAQVTTIVATEETRDALEDAAKLFGLDVHIISSEMHESASRPQGRQADLALMQFTSGSTRRPRGVGVSWDNLEAQIGMIRDWLSWCPEDSLASWLPLHHDMGLVGSLLCSVCSQTDLWLMSPMRFMRNPLDFLRCIGENGVTISPQPTFGYAYLARRIGPSQLEGTDFSAFRAAVIGAERIDCQALVSFAELILDHGFCWESLRPAYGLAEATLAVTGHPLGERATVLDLDWESVKVNGKLSFGDLRKLEAPCAPRSAVVSAGRPLAGTAVAIVNDRNVLLPEGYLGEIVVSGSAVAVGYEGEAQEGSTHFESDQLFTGDAGFVVDGELYVIGRMSDCFNVHGRRIYVEPVEAAIADCLKLPVERCAVVPGHGSSGEEVIAVLEKVAGTWVYDVVTLLRGIAGSDLGIKVYASCRHIIPKTTSGKKRRRTLAQQVLDGELAAELLYSSVEINSGGE
jgi:acyl-CoA synthetase (AMP-forming)/AMP-acid ligase II